jgi:hypothetical protein
MKKVLFIFVMLLGLSISAFAAQAGQVEDVANDVLTAYKNRDVELLKKHASAILKMSISESYFKDKAIQEDLKAVDSWDGKIREIRYKNKKMFGADVLMATAYFADAPEKDEIYTVLLSNFNNSGWVIFGKGLAKIKKGEFEQLSKTVPAPGAAKDIKPQKKAQRNLDIEMANGDTFKKVSLDKLVKLIDTLNDNNFYIILKDKEDYMQAAYSDKGYTVEYQNAKGHFTAHKLLSKDETLSLFKKYYQGEEGWEKSVVWDKQ